MTFSAGSRLKAWSAQACFPQSRSAGTRRSGFCARRQGNAEQGSPYIKRLVGELKTRLRPREPGRTHIKPIDRAYAGGVYLDRDDQTLNYNNNGGVYEKGWNTRLGFASRIDDLGRFSFYVNPETTPWFTDRRTESRSDSAARARKAS